jgi:hypothetical protein
MDSSNLYHKELYESGQWFRMSFPEKLGNIGSEISRANKWKGRDQENATLAFYRSLELIDLTRMKESKLSHSELHEISRFREMWIDFFYGENIYNSSADFFQKYVDAFAIWNYKIKSTSYASASNVKD